MLTKEELLARDDLGYVEVDVPEWGGKVRLKAMSGAVRDAYETAVFVEREAARKEGRNARNVRARMAVYSIVDDKGVLLFSESEIAALGEKSSKALDRIFDAASELNGFNQAEKKALEKN